MGLVSWHLVRPLAEAAAGITWTGLLAVTPGRDDLSTRGQGRKGRTGGSPSKGAVPSKEVDCGSDGEGRL